ncbi:Uncharacterised protein [Mycobacteroides abscessus subsp. abscessus]|nr:Uncharacterised protein [Mycobacteroides abscessus subsp. abscessus]
MPHEQHPAVEALYQHPRQLVGQPTQSPADQMHSAGRNLRSQRGVIRQPLQPLHPTHAVPICNLDVIRGVTQFTHDVIGTGSQIAGVQIDEADSQPRHLGHCATQQHRNRGKLGIRHVRIRDPLNAPTDHIHCRWRLVETPVGDTSNYARHIEKASCQQFWMIPRLHVVFLRCG